MGSEMCIRDRIAESVVDGVGFDVQVFSDGFWLEVFVNAVAEIFVGEDV